MSDEETYLKFNEENGIKRNAAGFKFLSWQQTGNCDVAVLWDFTTNKPLARGIPLSAVNESVIIRDRIIDKMKEHLRMYGETR